VIDDWQSIPGVHLQFQPPVDLHAADCEKFHHRKMTSHGSPHKSCHNVGFWLGEYLVSWIIESVVLQHGALDGCIEFGRNTMQN
jgi:hypothetical protein